MYTMFDGIELKEKSPREIRLLQAGKNSFVKEGKEAIIDLTPDRANEAANIYSAKGEKIPIDSRHALFEAAKAEKMEESDYLRQFPQGIAAIGFGAVEKGSDGSLWLKDIEWTPLAGRLFDQGSLRYFSPVIRGLDGKTPFRITSVAIDNVPALTQLPIIAAGGETPEYYKTKGHKMNKLEESLHKLLGCDTIDLNAEGDAIDELVAKISGIIDELTTLREQAKKTIELEKEVESLGAENTALKLSAEQEKKKTVIDLAMKHGRVCEAQRNVLMTLDCQALGEFIAACPENSAVPCNKDKKCAQEEESILSDAEKEIAAALGVSEEAYLAAKKQNSNPTKE